MIHLNGNLLCAIDVETTGLDPKLHDIIQIAILPLGPTLEPHESIMPFDLKIKPSRLETVDMKAMSVSRTSLADICINGMESELALQLYDDWVASLNLGRNHRISPLAHNWVFDQAFIREWLGDDNYAHTIDGRYRDTMACALFLNDFCDFNVEQVEYTRVGLSVLAKKLHLDVDNAHTHNALYDCILTAQVYKQMLRHIK